MLQADLIVVKTMAPMNNRRCEDLDLLPQNLTFIPVVIEEVQLDTEWARAVWSMSYNVVSWCKVLGPSWFPSCGSLWPDL